MPWRLGAGLLLVGCAARSGSTAEHEPRVRTIAVDLRAEPDDRRACGGCHAQIVDEWEGSEHRGAWSDPVFAAGYAVDPQPECRQCHAPQAEGGRDPDPASAAARSGVGCRSCHAARGQILGHAGSRVHGGPVDPGWGSAAACEGCHEFSFFAPVPGRPVVFDPGELMQRTLSEWSGSGSEASCQDCHMPWRRDASGGRHRSHAFLGIHDSALMAAAVRVQLSRVGEEIEVEVSTDAIGHAFPTGDMFRRAELRVWPEGEPQAVQSIMMSREFGPVARPDDQGRTRVRMAEVRDTRPRPGAPLRRRLRFDAPPSALRWQLDHLRMPDGQAARQGVAALNRRTVAQGRWATEDASAIASR